MTDETYSPQELNQAERLEQYLAQLEHKEILPPDVTPADVKLFAMARQFYTWRAQTATLAPPIGRQRSLKKILSWGLPLPLVASLAIWLLFWKTSNQQPMDVSAELALIEHSEADLMLIEEELNAILDEIDVLTATDYIDQL